MGFPPAVVCAEIVRAYVNRVIEIRDGALILAFFRQDRGAYG